MKSLISLAMVVLLAVSMMQLAVAQYSGTMNSKLLYGVAKEVRSSVRYSMVTVGEGLHPSNTHDHVTAKRHSTPHHKPASAQRTTHKSRTHSSRSRYARHTLR